MRAQVLQHEDHAGCSGLREGTGNYRGEGSGGGHEEDVRNLCGDGLGNLSKSLRNTLGQSHKNISFVFLPGLGADSRLFRHQQKAFKNIVTPRWIYPEKNESLADYARRWATELKLKKGCVLVGISFGGMVALEMARWVRPKAVLLIGSCRSPDSIPFILKWFGSFSVWPVVGKTLARTFPFGRGWFLGVEKKGELDLLMKMFLETPGDFLKWTVDAIRGWEGYKGKEFLVRHIHGQKDRLIPCRNVRPDKIIPKAGHTIILTHPKEVNAFIREQIF